MGIMTAVAKAATMQTVSDNRGWGRWAFTVQEPSSGAWQRDIEWTTDTVLAHHAVYACITLIASDIGKLRPKLVLKDADGIWTETESAAFGPVLRKPNRYQNHIQFKEWWITSKLIHGNAYALKDRDRRGVVVALYLLDPSRVTVMVSPEGAVFYQLGADNLSGLKEVGITVPASEIIHDRMNCLFHPLVGVSPIFASGLAANVGLKIQGNSARFFAKGSNPSGILSAPTEISHDEAEYIQKQWENNFGGDNSGRVAVVGNNLKFEPMRMTAVDSQLIQHLKWTAETVCSTFHVPPFKVAIGNMPTFQNAEILNGIYYSDCLQSHIESFEAVMDDGLGLLETKDGKTLGIELDLDALLRMDSATQIKTLSEGIGGGVYTPNEARRKVDLKPLVGGDTVYLQQQEFSLAALAKRDARPDPFATSPPPASPTPPMTPPDDPDEPDDQDMERGVEFWRKATTEYARVGQRMAA